MRIVVVPVLLFVCIVAFKKLPVIGGRLRAAFLLSGLAALVMGGKILLSDWLHAWVVGLDKIEYILWIVLIGSVFSALQITGGAMDTVLRDLCAVLGKSIKGIVMCALICMYIGGALMGTVTATAAVVGILVVPLLDETGMSPTMICAFLVTGGSMGAIMPPVSNAIIIAATLVGVDVSAATSICYVTIGTGLVFVSWFFCRFYIADHFKLPETMVCRECASEILRRQWKNLMPLAVLLTLVLAGSLPAIDFDIARLLLGWIPLSGGSAYTVLAGIPVLGSFLNRIVQALFWASIVSFVMNYRIREKIFREIRRTLGSSRHMMEIQLCAAVFLGAFTTAGQMDAISAWVCTVHPSVLIVGGGLSLMPSGMLLGAQSTSQSLLTPILASAWQAIGISPVHAAVASAHLAAAGQGLPPADVNTFAIAGLVSSILHKDVNPLKSMYYTSFYCFYLAAAGFLFLII